MGQALPTQPADLTQEGALLGTMASRALALPFKQLTTASRVPERDAIGHHQRHQGIVLRSRYAGCNLCPCVP